MSCWLEWNNPYSIRFLFQVSEVCKLLFMSPKNWGKQNLCWLIQHHWMWAQISISLLFFCCCCLFVCCLYVCVVCSHVWRCLWRPKEGSGPYGAGAAGCCELYHADAGNQSPLYNQQHSWQQLSISSTRGSSFCTLHNTHPSTHCNTSTGSRVLEKTQMSLELLLLIPEAQTTFLPVSEK